MITFKDTAIVGIGKNAAITGFANEHIVLAMLMTHYPNSSLVDMPIASYDLIIERSDEGQSKVDFLRAQIKTATSSVSFVGGSRGGVDRTYTESANNTKIYTHDTTKSDVVIGVHRSKDETTLYCIPSLLIPVLNQKTLSVNLAGIFSDWNMIAMCDKEDQLRKHLQTLDSNNLVPKNLRMKLTSWLD